jgi:ABC-2 type transport system ATP-binding protein
MKPVIEVKNLNRFYKTYSKKEGLLESIKGLWNREYTQKAALADINLSIEPGQIVGLIGSNGAGKTTLLKILSGLIYPTSGKARVLGYEPWKREPDFLKKMSLLLGQKNQLWWDISARDSYGLLADIYDLNATEAKNRVNELADMLNCRHVLDTQLRRLSLGERMKMEIIGSLLHRPEVLFLDEPTIGLDIVSQTAIRHFLEKYVKEFKPVIILTSHYMDDISELADRLLLMSKGRIVYDGTVDAFTANAKTSKKIIYRYKNETQEHELTFESDQLSEKITEIVKNGEIIELKINEVDFEEVIHRFLAKESHI